MTDGGARPALLALLLLLGQPLQGLAQPYGKEEGTQAPDLATDIHETIVKLPVTVTLSKGAKHTGEMIVTHYKPKGGGPFPAVVMNHGRSIGAREEPPRWRYVAIARFWIRRGFAVFVPTRLGYGQTGVEPDPEFSGPCNAKNYRPMIEAVAAQTGQVVAFARRQRWADGRVVLMGQSVGGLSTVGAAGRNFPGVVGAINFAGGSGGDPSSRPERPCAPDKLAAVFAEAGKTAEVPLLSLYAANDRFWGSSLPRVWHRAFLGAGGKGRLIVLPPVSDDGHKLLVAGFRFWRKEVDDYLAGLDFRTPASSPAPEASEFAALDDAAKVPFINPEARDQGYQKFLDADVPRAFAIAPTGAWGFGTGEDATSKALGKCQELAKRACDLYAVDDRVVWRPN